MPVLDRKHLCPGIGGIPQQSFILGSSALRSSSLPFCIFFFLRKKVPLPYTVPSTDKWYLFQIPSLELSISFTAVIVLSLNCDYITKLARKFSRLFHSHKILLLALLGPFTDQNDTDFPSLSYTSTIKILNPFIHLKSGRGTPVEIRTKLPRRSHYRGYPSGFMLALLAKSETISLPWSNHHATKLIIFLRWMSTFIYDVRGWWLVLFSFLFF